MAFNFKKTQVIVVLSTLLMCVTARPTDNQEISGKMLGANVQPQGFPMYPPINAWNSYNGAMPQPQMGYPPYGGYPAGPQGYPGGQANFHAMGGTGYIPNYLQQYDYQQLYSRSRKI